MLSMNTLSKLALLMAAATSVVAYNGDMTWYTPGQGACGPNNAPGDSVVALNPVQYGGGSACGKTVTIHYDGKTATGTVADLCPGCVDGAIDAGKTVFQQLANPDIGRIPVSWELA